jgi:hypothetical protein
MNEISGPRIGSGNVARVEEVEIDRLQVGDRSAFVKIMADLIGCAPSSDVIKEWAAKYPDRYFYSLKMVGGLMGLAEKVEHEGTIIHAVMNLPDAELMKRLEELKTEFKHPMMKDG